MGVRDTEPAELSLRLGQSLMVIAGAFLAANVLAAPAEPLVQSFGGTAGSAEVTVVQTVGQFLGFILVGVVFLAATTDREFVSVEPPTVREAGLIGGGVVVLLAVQFLLLAVFEAVGVEVGTNSAIAVGRDSPTYFLYMLPVSVLLVGPGEELLFRGIIQGKLKQAVGARAAIVAAALMFGLIHFDLSWTATQWIAYVSVAATLGAGLGLLYEHTDNLTVPAVTHGLYNASLFGFQYLVVTGVV